MANPEHVALVKKGAESFAAWRESHPTTRLDLAGADLVVQVNGEVRHKLSAPATITREEVQKLVDNDKVKQHTKGRSIANVVYGRGSWPT